MVCLLAMMAASLNAKAQEVTITLYPGWTWISYPNAETMDISSALGDFVPASGDIIQSQYSSSTYVNGYWRGGVTHFMPGWGYMYYSNRTEAVSFVFGEAAPQITVTTAEPTEITAISAVSGGSITSNDGSYVFVLEKGICWATHPNPIVINDFYTENGEGLDSFTVEMNDLDLNTVYYVRAYVVTADGTYYGEEKSFTTRDGIPTVNVDSITNISRFGATCYGSVIDNGGLDITTRGVCWSTNHNPTLYDNYAVDSMGLGGFSFDINSLYISTTYYVRAFATNCNFTVYGDEISFTTLESVGSGDAPIGAINGLFTINSNGNQVYFSKGNLQYQASTNTWRFAEDQWNYVGENNGNISPTYDGWIDLFSWGTGNDPTYVGVNQSFNEWGDNPIVNGGNQEGEWRTLSVGYWNGSILWEEEWPYLLNSRTTMSGIRYAKAQVNSVNGIIIVPDNWDSSVYNLNNSNTVSAPFISNIISEDEWENFFEETGCVFLPAGGRRSDSSVYEAGEVGWYWSSSGRSSNPGWYIPGQVDYNAFNIDFSNSGLYASDYFNKSCGYSVRLVKNYNPLNQ